MTAHTWKIQGTKLPGLITDAILLDYELNELETVAITGTTIMVDVNEYGDGAYVLKVIIGETIYYVPFFDLSDANRCYAMLYKYILCKCDNPCNDCDEGLKARMYDMNSILTLTSSIIEMMCLEKYQYLGLFSMDQTRGNMVDILGSEIEKLKIITDRCGLCKEGESNCLDC